MAGRLFKGTFSGVLAGIILLCMAGIVSAGVSNVICVPWQGDPLKPHTALSGTTAKLKCVIKTTDKNKIYTKWVFGDGTESSVASLSGSTKYNVEASHTYTGAAGTPFTARILVDTESSMVSAVSDNYLIKIEDDTLDSRVNIAIDSGLWWLYKNGNTDLYYTRGYLHTLNSSPFMVWNQSNAYWASPTASAVQAFSINNHRITGNPLEDPYVEAVQLGINWLVQGYYSTTSCPMLQAVTIAPQHGDDPEDGQAQQNRIGIQVRDYGNQPIYQGGQIMDAIIASGVQPNDSTGRDFTGRGTAWTYGELLQDMCDMYAYGQYDGVSGSYGILGGWRYGWGSWPDNSACQWAAIGMIPAQQAPWNCTVPNWVKTYNANWLTYSHRKWTSGSTEWGGFGYTGPGYGWGLSASGLVQMAVDGEIGYDDPTTPEDERDPKWTRTERYYSDNWTGFLNSNNIYGWYALAKSMRLAVPQQVERLVSNNLDWYKGSQSTKGLAQRIVEIQNSEGYWSWSSYGKPLSTAWMIITLKPALFQASPIACFSAHPTPSYANHPIRFDPSCSGHSETGKDIENLISFEWDWNNDGVYDTATATPEEVTHSFPCAIVPCTYPVSLKVTDDSTPALTASFRMDIKISDPPHPPVADAGGPYRVSLCAEDSLRLDGSRSFDPNEGQHQTGCTTCPGDAITSFSWDLKEPLTDFTDKTGKIVIIPPGSEAGELGSYFLSSGPCTVGLKVTDNTKLAYPGSGEENLSDVNFEAVQVDECCIPGLDLKAEVTERGKVQVSWTLTGASGYDIYRSQDESGNTGFKLIKGNSPPDEIPLIDTSADLTLGTLYTYRVTTSDGCGSGPVNATPQCAISDLSGVSQQGKKVLLTWTPSCDGPGSCVENYAVYRSLADPPNPATDKIGTASAPPYEDSGLTSGVTYYYQVISSDGCRSNVVSLAGNSAPVANAGSDQVVECDGESGAQMALNGSLSSDPDGDTLSYAWSGSFGTASGLSPTVTLPLGIHTVTLTVSDGSIESTDTVSITVTDTTPPRISPPADIRSEQTERDGTPVSLGTPVVSDLCNPNPEVTHDGPSVFPLGETLITWTARDASGNSATATQKVTVVDTTAPLITPPADIEIEQANRNGTSISLGTPNVSDICDAGPIATNNAPSVFPLGETLVTWTVHDTSGNIATAVQKVTVVDTTSPRIIPPADIEIEQANRNGTFVVLGSPNVSDICDAGPITTNNAPSVFPLGETLVTWTARDASGNTATAVQKVTVVDTTSPRITAPADIVVEQGGSPGTAVPLGSPVVFDICDAAPVTTHNGPPLFPAGESTVTWTVRDASGNAATATQKVTVVDTTPPEIIAPPDIQVEQEGQSGTVVLLGVPSVLDVADPDPAILHNAPAVFPLGETLVTWTARDASGNTSTAVQKVTVVDTTPPEIIAPPDIQVEKASGEGNIIELGTPHVSDICDATPQVTHNGPSLFLPGETLVTWTAQDVSGNTAAAVQKVSVIDSTPCRKYIRTTGKPDVYTDTFSTTSPTAKITVLSGEADGSNRVSSAIVTVNGIEVFKTSDFNQQVYRLEATIDLSAENTLMVELRSKPGSYLSFCIDEDTPASDHLPVADAGPDQRSEAGRLVQLDGSRSFDVDGNPLSYQWSLSAPEGSTAALFNASLVNPTFVCDLPGIYAAYLIVSDGALSSSSDSVVISTENTRPLAKAGADRTVFVGRSVALDASRSSDADGDALSYEWSFVSLPTGSGATLKDAGSVHASFTPDIHGNYEVRLVASDGALLSEPDIVVFSTFNSKPAANAGPNQTVLVGQRVILSGAGSFDPDGEMLTYEWSLTSTPSGSTAVLSERSAVDPTFMADLPGTYVAKLTVSDGALSSDPSTAVITTGNSPPVADAGSDKTVHLTEKVELDGSGSSDVDGNPLTFSWSLILRPAESASSLSETSAVRPNLVIDRPGTYVAQLVVFDGTVSSTPETVTLVTENSKPVANAGPDQTAHVLDTVILDGSGSSDVDGDLLTYRWSFASKPKGSTADLFNASALRPFFQVDVPGTYVAQLIVSDGRHESDPATVTVVTENSRSVAHAGSDQTVLVGQITTLDGSKSSDVDGDTLSFQWSFVSAPAGSAALLSDPAAVHPTFQPDLFGTYVVQLIVSDGKLSSNPKAVVISTKNSAPVANAGADKTAHVTERAQLDGSGSSDVDGNTLTFKWALIFRPAESAAELSDPSAVKPTFIVDKPGSYVAQLTVFDGTVESAPDTVTIVTENSRPVAHAGSDQTVFVGEIVTLNGSGSSDVDGDSLTFQWSFVSIPSGSTAALNGATKVSPAFRADLPGTYVAQLIVSDGVLTSVPSTVVISTKNSAPVANAGADQTAHVTETVQLEGSGSSDVDGNTLTFKWALIFRPAESATVLSDPSAVKPTFVIDKPGTYIAQLIVNDSTVDSAPDSVTIVTENSRPVAGAGADQTAHIEETVTLDASKSFDVDGDQLTYQWSFASKPEGSTATLSEEAAVNPTFEVDLHGTYVLQLIVSDGYAGSFPDTVTILTENSKPVSNAGPDQTVFVAQVVTLDGSKSSDVDGDTLTYQWSFTSIPNGSTANLSGLATVNPTFTPDLPGTYVAQLIVHDGSAAGTPDTVVVSTQNSPPVAKAGADQTGHVSDIAQLDGSLSKDVDGDALTFRWSITSKPAGSEASLTDPASVRPSFVIDEQGTYVVQLIVNDGTVDSAPDTVMIATENSRPVAVAGADQSAHTGDIVTLDGAGSSDVDGDLLTYRWSFSTMPAGSGAALSDPSAVRPTFKVDVPGTYILQLTVNDGILSSSPDMVAVITENSRPLANAGSDQTAFVGSVVTLDGTGSFDIDMDTLIYQWSFTARPQESTAVLSDPASAHPTFTVDMPGTYVIQLMVSDGTLSGDPDTVVVSTENSRPVASAGADRSVSVNETTTLDAAGSRDADGDPLTYQWSFTTKPAGSTAALSDPASARPTFTVDVAGTYVAQLIVHDGKIASEPDTVVFSTVNRKPTAHAGSDQIVIKGDTVTLSGALSTDPDGDPLTFSWSFTSMPSGSTTHLTGAATQAPSFVADISGTYVVKLIVTDGMFTSDPDTVTVTAESQIKVPVVVGMQRTAAEAALTAAGLTVGTISIEERKTVPAGEVMSQNPGSGTQVPKGTAVALTISSGWDGPLLRSITVTPAEFTLSAGESRQFAATGAYSDGTIRNITEDALWSTAHASIAGVSPSGRVAALGAGRTTVSAAVEGVMGSGDLTVTPPKETVIVISPQNPVLLAGGSRTFTATAVLPDGTREVLTSGVAWTSSEQSVASVTSIGTASALSEGSAVITASKEGLTASSTLTVKSAAADTTPPTAHIISPVKKAIISSGPAAILGTATDQNFVAFALELLPLGGSSATLIAEGASPIVNGVLGAFDPGELPNGFYTIRLTVLDAGGNMQAAEVTTLVAARGLAYLSSHQNLDGSWGDGATLTDILPETVAALEAIEALGKSGLASYEEGASWLQSRSLDVTDYLSQKIRALSATDEERLLLLSYLDTPTGGFGGSTNFCANHLDTALALQALFAIQSTDTGAINTALNFLISNQNADGGWGFSKGDPSTVFMTAVVFETLQRFSGKTGLDTAVLKATAWLMTHRNPDGGFGDGGTSSFETALALLAISSATADTAALQEVVDYLTSSQHTDGSWDGEPYCTGLALRALIKTLSIL